ncbi:MAG: acyltransferase [Candidatus Eremiobacteraeota bacterium]|nr:acyltransferase [Candidatus Eremiobacteraeota bacterium]
MAVSGAEMAASDLCPAQGAKALESPRLGVLDGLRGIAVLLVLWYHVWEISWLSPGPRLDFIPATGFIGVHLFFFLSGFVISYPFITATARRKPQPTWGHFAWRRFIKIVPSYVLSIAVAYAIGYAQVQPNASLVPDLVSHLLFVHTWFPDRYGTIDGVLWTLAVEVEFYCIFPLVWWCFKRRPWLTCAAMIAIAWIWRASMAHCCYATLFAQWEENLPGYLDIFAFGMIGAYVFVRFGDRWRTSGARYAAPLAAAAGFAWLVVLLESLYDYRLYDQWSGVWQIGNRPLLGAAFAVIALGSLTSPRWWQVLLDNPPLRFLATISYNLYLYHQLVAREMLVHHLPPYRGDPHDDARWQARYTEAAFAMAIVQAALVTYCFERPLLRLKAPSRTAKDATRAAT